LPLGEPPPGVPAGAHPFLLARTVLDLAPDHPDVLRGRSAAEPRPDPRSDPGRRRPRPPRRPVRPRDDRAHVGARLALGHRPARPRGDAARGPAGRRMTHPPTTSQTAGPYF